MGRPADGRAFGGRVGTFQRLETERLVGIPAAVTDLDDWLALFRDPHVMATLRGVRPDDEVVQHLRDTVAHWERYGHGLWTFREKASGAFVGRCGLRNQDVGGAPEVELGYVLHERWWGQGLAAEMGRAAVDDAFARFAYETLVAFTLPTNLRSRRVMEKLGFVYERDFTWADLSHVLYRKVRP